MTFSNQNNEEATTAMEQLKPKTRRTFLTLPRELRQKILYKSYLPGMSVAQQEPPFMFSAAVKKVFNEYNQFAHEHEKVNIGNWASELIEVCPEIHDDVVYVKVKWVEVADRMRAECEHGSYLFCKASLKIAERCRGHGDENSHYDF